MLSLFCLSRVCFSATIAGRAKPVIMLPMQPLTDSRLRAGKKLLLLSLHMSILKPMGLLGQDM